MNSKSVLEQALVRVVWYNANKGLGLLKTTTGVEVAIHSSAFPKSISPEAIQPGDQLEISFSLHDDRAAAITVSSWIPSSSWPVVQSEANGSSLLT